MSDRPEVIHRDDALLVLFKPAGLATTSPDDGPCLVREAARLDPRAPALHPTSRLDAEVTGLVTFARTKEANRTLLDARKRGLYRRLYVAITAHAPEPREGTWSWAIGIDPADKRKRRALAESEGSRTKKDARTEYETLEAADAGALLGLRPRTGRTHQLRVHAAHAGAALLGDVHYGGERRVVREDGRVVTARRVMLHCAELALPDVARGAGTLSLRAPIPDDMRRVWRGLGGSDAAWPF